MKIPITSYTMGETTWKITSREWVEEKVYVPPKVDPISGQYMDWGSYENIKVWKETTGQPFVF